MRRCAVTTAAEIEKLRRVCRASPHWLSRLTPVAASRMVSFIDGQPHYVGDGTLSTMVGSPRDFAQLQVSVRTPPTAGAVRAADSDDEPIEVREADFDLTDDEQ